MAGMDHSQHMATGAAPTSGAGMAGMAGMNEKITIPSGANITEADVQFMQGMIGHHSQAIFMSKLATTRGANPRVLRFAQKIDQSQASEIILMEEWLRHYKQSIPGPDSHQHMSMPGMLTPEQIKQLEAARGGEFDRLFLTFMIQHHEGALKMVKDLFATPRAGQEVDISVFANDVEVTQTAEIGTMRQMLAGM